MGIPTGCMRFFDRRAEGEFFNALKVRLKKSRISVERGYYVDYKLKLLDGKNVPVCKCSLDVFAEKDVNKSELFVLNNIIHQDDIRKIERESDKISSVGFYRYVDNGHPATIKDIDRIASEAENLLKSWPLWCDTSKVF